MKKMNRGDSDEVTGESSQTWNRVDLAIKCKKKKKSFNCIYLYFCNKIYQFLSPSAPIIKIYLFFLFIYFIRDDI